MIFSLFYLFSANLSLTLGLYTFFKNKKNRTQKIFLLLTIVIFLWAFTYALMNISNTVELATFLHRIGSIFYSFFYAIFLHLIIILSKHENLLNKKRVLSRFCLYLPAFISFILYFIISPVKTYEHFKTPLGWGYINDKTVNMFIFHYFNVYYITYSLFALFLLVRWLKNASYIREKKQATLLILSILSVFILGTATDIIWPIFGSYPLPPIATILLSIPILAIWRAINKFNLLQSSLDISNFYLFRSTKTGIIILNDEMKITEISSGALNLLEESEEKIKEKGIWEFFPYLKENKSMDFSNIRSYAIKSNHEKIPLLLNFMSIKDEFSEKIGYLLLFDDISEITNLQDELEKLNESLGEKINLRTIQLQNEMEKQILQRKKYQTLFDNSQDAVAECNEKGIIVNINESFERLFEYKRDEAIGKHIDDVVNEQENKNEGIEITNKVLENNVITLEGIRITKNKKQIYTLIRGVPIIIDGKAIGGFAIYTDLTKNKEYEDKLKIMAQKDALTDLYNLNQFEEFIENSNFEEKLPIGLIVSDINGLKFINDSFGHDVGDKLLKSYAQILLHCVRKDDLVFRIGGDEFLILITNGNNKLVEEVIKRIENNIVKFNEESKDKTIIINSSSGYSLVFSKEEIRGQLKKADDMMYRNKLLNKSSNKNTILKVLLSALAEKDYITMGHTNRVLEICRKIAEKMNLEKSKKDNLFLLSEVHDIGKIAIPDSILQKPGKLSESEWEIMKSHSEKGYRIAINSEELSNIAELVLKHHERWDGKGYPLGLKGEEIPIECRILSIADSFDAMTSQRPYNIIKNVDQALDEIINCSGKQYDPYIVEIFNQLIIENEIS
ncbi:MAG: diguanylate cyclase [Spirochaetales bacterium]|nr:diguanylate cyclase [Spirochaetales bacterium]